MLYFPMRSYVLLLTTCSSIIYAQAPGLCCCGCPTSPCPLKLSEKCVIEPLMSCAQFKHLSRPLPSCTALISATDPAKTEAPLRDPKATTPPYDFIPIPVVPLTTPFPGTILRMTSAGNPAHSLPGVIIYPHTDNQSQGALIKPGIGYGLNGPLAIPNRIAFTLSDLISGIANNFHNFIESLGFNTAALFG